MKPSATCELWVDGARMPDKVSDLQAGLATVLDEPTVTWGRSDVLEQPSPAVAAFKIHDPRKTSTPLSSVIRVGSKVEMFAVGEMPSPGDTSVMVDGGFEDTLLGELPQARFDAQLAGPTAVVDVAELDDGHNAVRITAEPVRVDPPAPEITHVPAVFTPYRLLVPNDRSLTPQAAVLNLAAPDDIYMSQIDYDEPADNLTIVRFHNGGQVSSMSFPGGGHGDLLYVSTIKGRAHVTFRYGGASGATERSGVWVRVPYTAGKTWTAAQAKAYRCSAPARSSLGRRGWFQGETGYGPAWARTYFRIYGGPYNEDGPTQVDMPAFIERIEQNAIVETIDASGLGRVGLTPTGAPVNGRLEPEALSLVMIGGEPQLLVGITIGTAGSYAMQLYRCSPDTEGVTTSPDQPDPEPEEPLAPAPLTVVFPPLPFAQDDDPPGAWDSVPRIEAGQTWPVSVRVRVPVGTVGTLSARLYTSPLASSLRSSDLVTVDCPPIVGDGTWQMVTGSVTMSPAADAPAWVALGVTVVLPAPTSWATAPGAWNVQTAVWEDYATAYVDDLVVLVPNSTERRVLVFSGRATDTVVQAAGAKAVEISVTATDLSADLANDTISASPWPAESLAARTDKVAALARLQVPILVDDTLEAAQVSYRDVDSQPVLGLLQDLAQSVGAAVWTASHATTGPYLWMEDPATRQPLRNLVVDDGLISVTASRSGLLSGCDILRDPVSWKRSVSEMVTVVDVTWIEQGVDEEGKPTTTDRTVTVVDTADVLALYGIRRLSVATELTSANAATALATTLLVRARNLGWRAEGYTLDTASVRAEIPSVPDTSRMRALMDLLDGTTRIGLGVTLTDLPEYAPAGQVASAYVEGGSYTYADGHWSLALTISSAEGQGGGITWDELPDWWAWQDFSPELTWADLYGTTLDLSDLGDTSSFGIDDDGVPYVVPVVGGVRPDTDGTWYLKPGAARPDTDGIYYVSGV